jgi:hypothetical protein
MLFNLAHVLGTIAAVEALNWVTTAATARAHRKETKSR